MSLNVKPQMIASIRESLLAFSKLFRATVANADSDNAENTDMMLRLGTGEEAWLSFHASSTGLGVAYIYEGATVTTSGATALTLYNLDRASSATCAIEAFSTPTVTETALGTLLMQFVTNGTTVLEALHLKSGTDYLLRHTSSADNTKVALHADLAEV